MATAIQSFLPRSKALRASRYSQSHFVKCIDRTAAIQTFTSKKERERGRTLPPLIQRPCQCMNDRGIDSRIGVRQGFNTVATSFRCQTTFPRVDFWRVQLPLRTPFTPPLPATPAGTLCPFQPSRTSTSHLSSWHPHTACHPMEFDGFQPGFLPIPPAGAANFT